MSPRKPKIKAEPEEEKVAAPEPETIPLDEDPPPEAGTPEDKEVSPFDDDENAPDQAPEEVEAEEDAPTDGTLTVSPTRVKYGQPSGFRASGNVPAKISAVVLTLEGKGTLESGEEFEVADGHFEGIFTAHFTGPSNLVLREKFKEEILAVVPIEVFDAAGRG